MERSLGYISSIMAAVDLPVSADFLSGYGRQPEDVAESVTRCVTTGVAGLSIEDATGDLASPMYELSVAVERVGAVRQAIDRSGEDVLLTARAECYHVGHPGPFRESVRRLQAYAAAGARRGAQQEAAEVRNPMRARTGLEFDDPTLRGHRDRVGPVGDVQLQENGLEMRLDGLLGQPEVMGDLLVGLSHRDEAQHCHLAFGQRVIGDVRRDFAGDVAMNVAATAMHVANGL